MHEARKGGGVLPASLLPPAVRYGAALLLPVHFDEIVWHDRRERPDSYYRLAQICSITAVLLATGAPMGGFVRALPSSLLWGYDNENASVYKQNLAGPSLAYVAL